MGQGDFLSFEAAQAIGQSRAKSLETRLFKQKIAQFCQVELGWQLQDPPSNDRQFCQLFFDLWLPLALLIQSWQRSLGRPLIQGILGGQGTGKSTLAAILSQLLSEFGLKICRLSLDDLYKTYAERWQLQQADSRLRWRGPPGTHDIELGMRVLQALRQLPSGQTLSEAVALPRFDKSAEAGMGDRAEPEWVTGADIIFLEGWFVGVRPIDPIAFETAPPPIETESDRIFARDMNVRLQDYLPLWDLLDRLIVLCPQDFRLSQQWRQQAEQQMRTSAKSGMSDAEIEAFVTYFWRSLHPELFITPLLQEAERVDLVIQIDAQHLPEQIYQPRSPESVSKDSSSR